MTLEHWSEERSRFSMTPKTFRTPSRRQRSDAMPDGIATNSVQMPDTPVMRPSISVLSCLPVVGSVTQLLKVDPSHRPRLSEPATLHYDSTCESGGSAVGGTRGCP